MNLIATTYKKLSVVLISAVAFLTLPTMAATTVPASPASIDPDGGVHVILLDGSVRHFVAVSRLSLPAPSSLVVDPTNPNVIRDARALFEAAAISGKKVVITVPRGTFPRANFQKIEFVIIEEDDDRQALEIELERVLVSGYQVGGSGTASQPSESYSLNFTEIKFKKNP